MNTQLTDWEADVLQHASRTGRYVTGEARVLELARRGLLYDHGAQTLAGGDHYLTTAPTGRKALNEWSARQPVVTLKKPRRSEAFASWRAYEEASGRLGFAEFLKKVWPHRLKWTTP
ncbi:MAG TPA: hypothetical protein VGO11_19800 [Chthoniobacteraceae bacterium]|jgi:hypothetical protein|nr:hypothetical protein [Chthoniobacteraceae bacterium]